MSRFCKTTNVKSTDICCSKSFRQNKFGWTIFSTLLLICGLLTTAIGDESPGQVEFALRLIAAGRHDDASTALANVHTTRSYNLQATLKILDQEFDDALQLLDMVLVAHPDSRYTRMNKIIALFELGRFESVISEAEILRKYIEEGKTPVRINAIHGRALLKEGRVDEGKRLFSEVLLRDASN